MYLKENVKSSLLLIDKLELKIDELVLLLVIQNEFIAFSKLSSVSKL